MDPWFALLREADRDGSGALSLAEVRGFVAAQAGEGKTTWALPRMPDPARLPEALQGGVAPGRPAPDFTLEPPGGGAPFTLSAFRGRRPVALVFGSYT